MGRPGDESYLLLKALCRAAAVWSAHWASGAEPLTAKSLASKAFRNSKGWTPERELAFASLTGTSWRRALSSDRV